MVGGELVEDSDGLGAAFAVGSRVAGYRLKEQIGAGGMAMVFRARDERLGRQVALKIMTPALAADEVFRQRFIREWRAAAAVDDPHIIPVYEAGQAGRVLFLAMRFVGGGDVRSLVRREGPLAPERAAAIISSVASALDAAHKAGLVHRDVKPANMLLDGSHGRPDHVYLSDFGLSKGALSSGGLTGSGQFLGTPNYTAPEQIEGLLVDGRADQYALACAAFELLTGAPPFRKDDPMAVIYAQVSEPPPRLTARRPGMPPAADRVFARALAKTPQNRYATCGGFAKALREALHPKSDRLASDAVPAAEHFQTEITWTSGPGGQNVAVQAQAAADDLPDAIADSAAAVKIPASTTITSGRRATQLGLHGDEARHRRGTRRLRVPAALAGIGILAVALAATILAMSFSHEPAKPSRDASGNHRSYAIVMTLASVRHSPISSVVFSPDGKTLATSTTPRTFRGTGHTYLWDLATGRRTATLALGNTGPLPISVAFSPDGKTMATTGETGHAYLWDVATLRRTATLTIPRAYGSPISVAFSPDGKTLATSALKGKTYLWDVATLRRTATLTNPKHSYAVSLAFSPDGKTLAIGDPNNHAYLWDVATSRRTATLTVPGPHGFPILVAFSHDNKTLATTSGPGRTYLWEVATKRLTATLADPVESIVNSVAFSPDGKTVATGNQDGRTYMWNVATRRLIATLTDPGSTRVTSVAFSPNAKTLATGDGNGKTYLRDTG
jgi:serine/threonine protein kinase